MAGAGGVAHSSAGRERAGVLESRMARRAADSSGSTACVRRAVRLLRHLRRVGKV